MPILNKEVYNKFFKFYLIIIIIDVFIGVKLKGK